MYASAAKVVPLTAHFENRPTFVEVTNEYIVAQFFDSLCIYCIGVMNARRRISLYNPASLSEHQDRVPVSRTAATTTRRPL